MVSGILNDLNQSLSVAVGFLELAQLALDDGGQALARHRVALAARAARGAAASTNEVLTGTHGSLHPVEPIDVGRMLHEVAQLTAPLWGYRGDADGRRIAVRVETDCDLVALGAAHHLRSTLMSHMFDAIDALPTGGAIVLHAWRARECVEVDVGWGAALDALPATQFRLSLPVAMQSPAAPPRTIDHELTESLRVLVVEDSPTMRELMLIHLRHAGHDADAVSSGTAALARLQAATFDVVISDLSLGHELNGWDLARTIAEHWPGVGFILATGSAEDLAPERLASHGIDAVLSKPFRGVQLREAVVRVGMLQTLEGAR